MTIMFFLDFSWLLDFCRHRPDQRTGVWNVSWWIQTKQGW